MTAAEQVAAARKRLDEWEAVEKAAGPGPWHYDNTYVCEYHGYRLARIEVDHGDGDLIVAARNAFPGLIAVCRTVLYDFEQLVGGYDRVNVGQLPPLVRAVLGATGIDQ